MNLLFNQLRQRGRDGIFKRFRYTVEPTNHPTVHKIKWLIRGGGRLWGANNNRSFIRTRQTHLWIWLSEFTSGKLLSQIISLSSVQVVTFRRLKQRNNEKQSRNYNQTRSHCINERVVCLGGGCTRIKI